MREETKERLLLRMRQVSFSYDRKPLLRQIHLDVRPGRILGVAGGNGAGKTTLLKLAAGLLLPQEGTVERFVPEGLCPVSYCMPPGELPGWMTGRDLLAYYRHFFQDFRRQQAEGLLDSLGIPRNRPLDRLSTVQAVLLSLSLGLSRQACLYLADEPCSHIEPALRRDVRRFLLRYMPEESSLLMATHQLGELEYMLDELVILHRHTARQIETESIRSQYGVSAEDYFLAETGRGKPEAGTSGEGQGERRKEP